MEPWQMHGWHEEFLDACNRHDRLAIGQFMDHRVRRAHRPAGAEAWLDELDELFRGFPDWRWRRIQVVAEDDRLAVHLRGSGTHTGAFRLLQPTRRHVNVAEFRMYRLSGERIVEATDSGDAELLTQIGG